MSLCTVTGNIKDLFDLRSRERKSRQRIYFTSGTVRFSLCRQPRTTLKPVCDGRAVPLQYDVDVQQDGFFKAQVESNDSLEPEKTFYEVSFMVPTFRHEPRFYRIIGSRLDLNSAVRFNPVSADVWVDDL
jgi:hypothetical protein